MKWCLTILKSTRCLQTNKQKRTNRGNQTIATKSCIIHYIDSYTAHMDERSQSHLLDKNSKLIWCSSKCYTHFWWRNTLTTGQSISNHNNCLVFGQQHTLLVKHSQSFHCSSLAEQVDKLQSEKNIARERVDGLIHMPLWLSNMTSTFARKSRFLLLLNHCWVSEFGVNWLIICLQLLEA